MLYIVGGVPRSGKTQVRKLFLREHTISGITTDILRGGFQNGLPEFGIYRGQSSEERSRKLWPFLRGMIEEFKYYESDFVLEGANLIPDLVKEVKNFDYVRICFLGYGNIDPEVKARDIRNYPSEAEWTTNILDTDLLGIITRNIENSKILEERCREFGLAYFDTSNNFSMTVRDSVNYLLENS